MSLCPCERNGSWDENAEFPELNNMCPSGKGSDDEDEKSPLEGYINGNIACVADGWTTVTFGGLIGSFRLPSSESEWKLISGDFCGAFTFSSARESSECAWSVSLSLFCGDTLLISDRSSSSFDDDVRLRLASVRWKPSLWTGSSTEPINGLSPKTSECIPCGIFMFRLFSCSVAMIPLSSVAEETSVETSSVASTQISVSSSSSVRVVSALACSLSVDWKSCPADEPEMWRLKIRKENTWNNLTD